MTRKNLSLPQRSPTFAVDETHNFQDMIRVAIRNATCITGRPPDILNIAKQSPFDIYANNDLKVSEWEDPWHIVGEISELQVHLDKNGPPAVSSKSRQDRPAGVSQVMRSGCSEDDANDSFRTRNVSADNPPTKGGYVKQEEIHTSEAVSGNKYFYREKTILATQSSWVPRIFQGRKPFMRVFPYELQNIMHAFGEARFCCANVLEFMEDAVRNIMQRVALGVLSRFDIEKLTVHNVSTCIRHDPRALHRLLFCLRRSRQKGEDLHVVRPTHREWDSFLHYATIHGIRVGEFPSLKHLEHIPLVSTHNSCNQKAKSMFLEMLGMLFKVQYVQCTQSYFTDRYSRCPTEGVGGRARIDLFREWLALPEYVQMTEGSLHALGSLAREAVGIITQTALVLKHRNRLAHSYERMLIDALSFGIGTAVLVPLSALQTYELLRALNEIDLVRKRDRNWGFLDGVQKEALEMSHVREAFRQLEDPDASAAHRPFWVGL